MKAIVKNFMGIVSAAVEAAPIALLIGKNAQGKSSTLHAIRAALTGQTIPAGLKKQDVGFLVHIGSAGGSVQLESDKGTAEINWPKAERRTTGENPPQASHIAAGLVSLIDMDDKKRIEYLRDLLKCTPSKEDLVSALSRTTITPATMDALWNTIQRDGWDATRDRTAKTGVEAKGEWRATTGEQWGSSKGDTWAPKAWDMSLTDETEENLEKIVSYAKKQLEDAIAKQAVTADKKAEAEKSAALVPHLENDLSAAQADSKQINEQIEIQLKKYNDLPALPEKKAFCPHCQGAINIKAGVVLEAYPDLAEADVTRIRGDFARLDKESDRIQKISEAKSKEIARIEAELDIARKAAVDAGVAVTKTLETDGLREAVKTAEARLDAFKKYTQAQRINHKIKQNMLILEIIDENGIRRSAMSRGLSEFNVKLAETSAALGWPKVEVNNDMTFFMSGRPYQILSCSEQYRVKITLQLAVADLDKSDAVVIDAAELLDVKGGLLRALSKRGRAAFVGMMVAPKKNDDGVIDYSPAAMGVPDLERHGHGCVYWIEGGESAELRSE